jgi:hypothetical protein
MNKNGYILVIQRFFQGLCLVSAFIDTDKNKWLEKRTKNIVLTYCFMVKTNTSTYKGAAIYLAGMSPNKI